MVAHIFTLLLAHFASKLVNYSWHGESLKYFWKSTNGCDRWKISSILEILWMSKVTNLEQKDAQRSVNMWATTFYKSFFENIRSLHSYVMHGMFYFELYCTSTFGPKFSLSNLRSNNWSSLYAYWYS